jgi:hypothetical protein
MNTDPHRIFVYATTTPFTIDLPSEHRHNKLFLFEYTIKGAPQTLSVPDNVFYNLIIEDSPAYSSQYIRNDQRPGIPLALTGGFTHIECLPPLEVARGSNDKLHHFRMRIPDQNGNPAVFSDIALCFQIQ